MAKSTLNIGQELNGDNLIYRIEAVLGQGSFGITYKAKAFTVIKGKFGEELVETNTPKAIKEFFMKEVNDRDASGSITGMSEGSLSYNYAQKFKKEAENLASMNHPNIVKVIDFISANNTYYYVMDFIEGENLNDYLKHHKMSEEEATATIVEVSKALRYMHEEKHMLHLDLKPGNIMRRGSGGHIFLIDFGLSKHYSDDGVPETSTSVGLGTPGYAPIEQANSKNAKKFRETLDVYALGATFYKLLTGQTPPFADEMLPNGEAARSELAKSGISQTLISTVVQAMYPIADERMQSVKAFLDSLNQGEDTETIVDTISVDSENTTLDSPENNSTVIKENTSTDSKEKVNKVKKQHKKTKPKPEQTENSTADKTQNDDNDGCNTGCIKTIFIIIALGLFLLWYYDLWIFSSKEEIPSVTPSEEVANSQDDNDVTIETDGNSSNDIVPSTQNIESNQAVGRKVNSTDEVVEKNGYRKNGNGTITDTKHHLMWMDEDFVSLEGHLIPNDSWKKAMEWCNQKNKERFAGYSDWRVPTVKELLTLARPDSQRKFYKSFFGGSRTEYFWSSNSVSSSVKSYVSMDDGSAVSGSSEGMGFQYGGTKLQGLSVRLVRDIK